MKNMQLILMVWLVCVSGKCMAQGREEFNGPFQSWADVKKQFGAKGNGKDDDTRALQRAIDGMSNLVTQYNMAQGQKYMVIYLPAGTYCVSSTLVMRGKIGVSIIGEDPARTVIKWTGGDKDTVLWTNGSAYFKISRITWDAGGKKDMQGIGIHWKDVWNTPGSRSFAACNIELSDCNFIGGFKYGISGGTYKNEGTGANDSEVTIRRCKFFNCTDCGLEIHGYNALDYWIWDCQFLSCLVGIRCAHGNYHAYRCFFSGSGSFDVSPDNCYYTSMRGCFSQNSYGFSFDQKGSCNPFKRIFQDNTVIRLKNLPIEFYHTGKMTFWDNRIDKVADPAVKYLLRTGSFDWCNAIYEALSINNRFGASQPFFNGRGMKVFSVKDQYVSNIQADSSAFLASLDKTPPLVKRKIFELQEGATADQIQSVIDQAAGMKGQRPVIHLAPGAYYLDKPLQIPAGADLQLKGDGLLYVSMLLRKPNQSLAMQPQIIVNGPSYVTISDMQIGNESDKGQQAGIIFQRVDQPGSTAILDQLHSKADTALVADGMDYLYVQKENSFFSTGNVVRGGKLARQNQGTAGVYCFGGQFANLSVTQNGVFMAKDCWWEGNSRIPLDINGWGRISIDGAMIAPAAVDSGTTIRIGNFKGDISLMNMYVQGALAVQPDNPGLNLLIWNIHFYHKMGVLGFLSQKPNYKGAYLGLTAQCFIPNDTACKLIASVPDQVRNIPDISSFLDSQTQLDRKNSPRQFVNLAAGVSNIRISRVSIGAMSNAIIFRSGS